MRNGITEPGSRGRLSLVNTDQPSSASTDWLHDAAAPLDVEIREVQSGEDRKALARFRTRVTVIDMNRRKPQPNHQSYARDDNLSTGGVQLIGSCQSEIVGTVQINYSKTRDPGVDADFYRMREIAGSNHPSGTCIFSRLLVDPAFRGGSLGKRLCVAAFRHALYERCRTAFLRCNDPLVFYFSTLGFKPYIGKSRHALYGEVLPMKLDLQEEKYLAMIHSPFVTALRAWKQLRVPSVRIFPKRDDPSP